MTDPRIPSPARQKFLRDLSVSRFLPTVFQTELAETLAWLEAEIQRANAAEARLAVTSTALEKIDKIRDSIVGRMQGFNFSEHIYPLVAALEVAVSLREDLRMGSNAEQKWSDDEWAAIVALFREPDARLRAKQLDAIGNMVNQRRPPPFMKCASAKCAQQATDEFISGDVGSWYCAECYAKIVGAKPAKEE